MEVKTILHASYVYLRKDNEQQVKHALLKKRQSQTNPFRRDTTLGPTI